MKFMLFLIAAGALWIAVKLPSPPPSRAQSSPVSAPKQEKPKEGWIARVDRDALDGKETPYWVLNSSNEASLPFLSGGPQRAWLVLQFKGAGTNEMFVRLVLPSARFDANFIGSNLETQLRIRYDDDPVERSKFTVDKFGPNDVALGDDDGIVAELRAGRRVRIEATFTGIDPVTAVFDFHPDKFPVESAAPSEEHLTTPKSEACEAVKKAILAEQRAPSSTSFGRCSSWGPGTPDYNVNITAKIPHFDAGGEYRTTYRYSGVARFESPEASEMSVTSLTRHD